MQLLKPELIVDFTFRRGHGPHLILNVNSTEHIGGISHPLQILRWEADARWVHVWSVCIVTLNTETQNWTQVAAGWFQ